MVGVTNVGLVLSFTRNEETRGEERMGFDDEKSQQQAHGPHHLILSKRANQPKIQIEKFRTEED